MSNSKKNSHRKKPHIVLSYFTNSIIYVLMSLIIIIPLSLVMLNTAVGIVHKAQNDYRKSPADVSISYENYKASDVKNKTVTIPDIDTCEKIGTLKCSSRGFVCDVYNNYNRVSKREGAGIYSYGGYPGEGREILIGGYSLMGFKALENIKAGDSITFETSWGIFEYKVSDVKIAEKYETGKDSEILVLSAPESKKAFSAYNKNQRYVIAKKVNGPTVKGVSE